MRLYGVSLPDASRVLQEPEKVAPAGKGRYNAYGKFGNGYLRVTYKEEETRVVIVTVTPRGEFEGVP